MGDGDGDGAALGGPAEQALGGDEQQQERQAGHHVRQHQRHGEHEGEAAPAAESTEAHEGETGRGADDRRRRGRQDSDAK